MAAEDVTITVDYGEPGKSAYDLAVSLGYVGTLQQWIASLNGGTATYIQSFAQASGLTTAAVIQVMARLNSPLPLPTGAATNDGLGAIVTAINNKPVTQLPDTLAKSTDFAALATDAKLDTLFNALSDLKDAIIQQATANGTNDDVVDALEELIPLVGGGGSVSLTDYATQTTLGSIDSKVPNKGQSNKAGSTPVTIANDQDSIATFTKPDLAVGGYRRFHNKTAIASNNNTTVNGGATALNWIKAMNFATTTRYIKIFNQSAPTIGTTVPIMRFMIPPATTVNSVVVPGILSEPLSQATLGTGFAYSFDTLIADSSTGGSVVAGDIWMSINTSY